MHSIAESGEFCNTTDWLALAHQAAEQERQRLAAYRAGHVPDFQREIADGQRILAEKRAQSIAERKTVGIDPLPRPAPVERPPEAACGASENEYTLAIGVYTRLAARIAQKMLAAGVLYWILQHRAQAQAGNNKFTVAELREYMHALGIVWSERRIRDALRQGRGLLWLEVGRNRRDRRQRVCAMRSKENVMIALDIGDPGAHVLIADYAWQCADVRTWRAHLWAAFVENHPGNGELSRETLARDFGVSRRQTVAYDRASHTIAHQQVTTVLQPRDNDHERWFEIAEHQTDYQWRAIERRYSRKRGRLYGRVWFCWQDVNRYESNSTRLAASHRRRYLIAGVMASNTENARINGDNGQPEDQGSSNEPAAPRFGNSEQATSYQRKHPDKPVKVRMSKPPLALTRHELGHGHAWEFQHSEQVWASA